MNLDKNQVQKLYLGENLKRTKVSEILGVKESELILFLKQNNIRKIKKEQEFCPLTKKQKEIIAGSLLGDGSLFPGNSLCPKAGWKFYKAQSKIPRGCIQGMRYQDRSEYLRWHFEELNPYSLSLKEYCVNNLTRCQFITHSHSVFREMAEEWYVYNGTNFSRKNGNNLKIIPESLEITPLVASIWFCDDGINKIRTKCAVLCTDAFRAEDVYKLKIKINRDLGINCHIGCGNRIYIGNNEGYNDFLEIIKPYIFWECFKYKINLDLFKPFIDHRGENHTQSKLKDKDIEKIISMWKTNKTLEEIGNVFGVSKNTISDVIKGKTWKHIKCPRVKKNNLRNKSGYVGVYKTKKKFLAQIMVKGKVYKSKYFINKKDAIEARIELERKYK